MDATTLADLQVNIGAKVKTFDEGLAHVHKALDETKKRAEGGGGEIDFGKQFEKGFHAIEHRLLHGGLIFAGLHVGVTMIAAETKRWEASQAEINGLLETALKKSQETVSTIKEIPLVGGMLTHIVEAITHLERDTEQAKENIENMARASETIKTSFEHARDAMLSLKVEQRGFEQRSELAGVGPESLDAAKAKQSLANYLEDSRDKERKAREQVAKDTAAQIDAQAGEKAQAGMQAAIQEEYEEKETPPGADILEYWKRARQSVKDSGGISGALMLPSDIFSAMAGMKAADQAQAARASASAQGQNRLKSTSDQYEANRVAAKAATEAELKATEDKKEKIDEQERARDQANKVADIKSQQHVEDLRAQRKFAEAATAETAHGFDSQIAVLESKRKGVQDKLNTFQYDPKDADRLENAAADMSNQILTLRDAKNRKLADDDLTYETEKWSKIGETQLTIYASQQERAKNFQEAEIARIHARYDEQIKLETDVDKKASLAAQRDEELAKEKYDFELSQHDRISGLDAQRRETELRMQHRFYEADRDALEHKYDIEEEHARSQEERDALRRNRAVDERQLLLKAFDKQEYAGGISAAHTVLNRQDIFAQWSQNAKSGIGGPSVVSDPVTAGILHRIEQKLPSPAIAN